MASPFPSHPNLVRLPMSITATKKLIQSIAAAELEVPALLEVRRALDEHLERHRDRLSERLRFIDGALRVPPGGKASVARNLMGGLRKPGARKARSGTKPPGRHEGLSVADAVRKVISAKGGKASAGDIKEAFAKAGDKRVLNFTILVNAGVLRRAGDAPRIKGKKGRAGSLYCAA